MKPTVAGMDAEPREQRLAEPLALAALDRHERRCRPVVEHLRACFTPNRLSRNAARPRDTQRLASTRARVAPLEPARQPDRRMPLPSRSCSSV